MSSSKQSSSTHQKHTTYTITSETAARRVIGRGGSNVKQMRQDLGSGLYVCVQDEKCRRVTADQLTADGYVTMTCKNFNGDHRTVNIFVGTSPPLDTDGNILVTVKPVMVSAWDKNVVDQALAKIDAITNRRESDLTATVSTCPEGHIKHVIGVRGSGLRRIENFVKGGCYISYTKGVFVIKANTKSSTLRGKIAVEKKITELVERFRDQKKKLVVVSTIGSTSGNPFDVFAAGDTDSEDDDELIAHRGVLADEAVVSVVSTTDSDIGDTVDETETSSSPVSLTGVWGSQATTISAALEDAACRGDTFSAFKPQSLLPK
jgi:hypothetical protein